MVKVVGIILLFMFVVNIYSQDGSFISELVDSEGFSMNSSFEPNEEGGGSVVFSEGNEGRIFLTVFDRFGYLTESVEFKFGAGSWLSAGYKESGNTRLGIARGSISLLDSRMILYVWNRENDIHWGKQIGLNGFRADLGGFLGDDKIFCSNFMENETLSDNKFGLAILDINSGNQVSGNYYKRNLWEDIEIGHFLVGLDTLPENRLVSLIHTQRKIELDSTPYIDIKYGNSLIVLDSLGEVINSIGFESDDFFLAKSMSSDNIGNTYVVYKWEGYIEQVPSVNAVLAKYNSELDLLWAKELYAENFPCSNIVITTDQNEDVVFAYITYGNLPVIAGRISKDGDILEYKGYSFYRPKISIAKDNSIFFSSKRKYYEDGTYENALIIAKTDSLGEFENCSQFNACLELFDYELEQEEWLWTKEEAPPLPDIMVEIDTSSFQTVPHCGTPLPPRADFALPDTICQGECIFPDSVYNRLAHQVEWRIQGVDLDTIISDSIFNWCFDIPGEYVISQEVWLLGCSEYFEENLTVLPDDLYLISPLDYQLCQDPPFQLSIEANRPLNAYFWEDGSQEAVREVNNSGEYLVTISDGYCEAGEQISFTFLGEYLGEELLTLPADTFICADDLPYKLVPFSPVSSSFIMDGVETPKEVFYLNGAGTYTISLARDSCYLFRTFTLDSESCDVPVYYPNSFSPNDDGINDYFEFLGNDYKGIKLEIYDRWGGQVFETDSFPFAWDGKNNYKKADVGVYIFLFQYRNEKNGKTYQISGDILVTK